MKKVIALGSIQNESYRSNGAQRLHTKIIGALIEKKELPKKYPMKDFKLLLEKSINDHSHLNDVLHIGHDKKGKDYLLSQLNTVMGWYETAFDEKGITSEELKGILLNVTKDGFTLLQDAVTNGDLRQIELVMGWYETAIDKQVITSEELKGILLNVTEDKFTLLQGAVTNGDLRQIELVMGWYRAAGLSQEGVFKEKILLNVTEDKFTLLQSAVKNGALEQIKLVMGWYETAFNEQVITKEELKGILLNVTNDGFTLLQDAVTNGDLEQIKQVMGWYRAAGLSQEGVFKEKILLNVTTTKFTLLQSAVKNGDLRQIELVMGWYETAIDEKVITREDLKEILLNEKKDKFTL
ncbi:MAG: hypothetical protein ACON35_02330 [Candidatus Marinamargulisbacteria bacterium]